MNEIKDVNIRIELQDSKEIPDKVQVYFNGNLQRELFIYGSSFSFAEIDLFLKQFQDKPCYEVYVNGQLYDVGD